jgi:hypothetical protein
MRFDRKKRYIEVGLTTADGSRRWTGKGPTEAAARQKAIALAQKAGVALGELQESVREFVGPPPRTFKGRSFRD